MSRTFSVQQKLSTSVCNQITDAFYDEIHTMCPDISKVKLYNFISTNKMYSIYQMALLDITDPNTGNPLFVNANVENYAKLLAEETSGLIGKIYSDPNGYDIVNYFNAAFADGDLYHDSPNNTKEYAYYIEDVKSTFHSLVNVQFF